MIYNQLYIEIIIAFTIDLIIGDPLYRLHPARIIGRIIEQLEEAFRKIPGKQKYNGLLFAIMIIFIIGAGSYTIIYMASLIDAYYNTVLAKGFVSVYLIYSAIAVKDMNVKARAVYRPLNAGSVDEARKQLSMIVGRDTASLNNKEICRACVESVSESITDGIVSPLFYAFIGGAPLVMAFKAVSTLDSMVGYLNERYRDFGYVSAKLDDLANYIPARIAGLLIAASSFPSLSSVRQAVRIMLRDGRKNPSPNSGVSQASVAGALGIQLGGTNYYRGKKIKKPVIGDSIHEIDPKFIPGSVRISYITAFLFLVLGVTIHLLISILCEVT